jgi:uncharacterized protein
MPVPVLHLHEIPQEGLTLSCHVRAEDLALGPEDAMIPAGLALAVRAVKAGAVVHVTGMLSGVVRRQCVRCLAEYDDALRMAVAAEYHRDTDRKHRPAGPEPLLQPIEDADDDVYFYTGEAIELAEMVREQVILATPMQPLCREDCRGLCPVCGQDLNVRRCACQEERSPSPFAVLKTLRETMTPSTHPARRK